MHVLASSFAGTAVQPSHPTASPLNLAQPSVLRAPGPVLHNVSSEQINTRSFYCQHLRAAWIQDDDFSQKSLQSAALAGTLQSFVAVTVKPSTFRYWIDFQALGSAESADLLEAALRSVGGQCVGGPCKADPLDGRTRKDGDWGHCHVEEWDFLYTTTPKAVCALQLVSPHQMASAIPGLQCISRKTSLASTLASAYGDKAWDIVPRSYKLPEQLEAWKLWVCQHPHLDTGFWMLKNNKQRGTGLRLVRTLEAFQACFETTQKPTMPSIQLFRWYLTQQYITDPMLVNGKKFGLRVWVLVSGTSPYRAYLHCNGLVLFANDSYSLLEQSDIAEEFTQPGLADLRSADCSYSSPLPDAVVDNRAEQQADISFAQSEPTNMSVPSLGSGHVTNVAQNESSIVWNMDELRSHMGDSACKALWAKVTASCKLTFQAASSHVAKACKAVQAPSEACFQLFGLDFLLNQACKPWLLEVNASPSMKATHEDADTAGMLSMQKGEVVADMVRLLGVCVERFEPTRKILSPAAEIRAELHRRGGFEPLW